MGKFYVYNLIDPRNGEVFYVGKGAGHRVKQHVRDAVSGRVTNRHKHRRIMEILDDGDTVIERIVADFDTERDAYKFERTRIRELKEQLTNISHGTKSTEEVAPDRARHWLTKIKPFDVWVATTSEYRKNAVRATGVTLREFYDEHVSFMSQMAAMG